MVKNLVAYESRSQHDRTKKPAPLYIGGPKADRTPAKLMGRVNRHLYDKMLTDIQDGASLKAAAGAIGLRYETVAEWLRLADGLPPTSALMRFRRDVDSARSGAISEAEKHIRKRDPKAWLQANSPERWHPEQQLQSITIDARKVAYIEHVETSDLAKTLAVFESLGMVSALEAAQPPIEDKQEQGMIAQSENDQKTPTDDGNEE